MTEITNSLCQSDELFSMWASRRRFPSDYYTGGKTKEEWDEIIKTKREREALERMRKKKWIRSATKGEKVIFQIHRNAMIESLKFEAINCKHKLTQKEQIIVMFDFPVAATPARNKFRRLLKQMGFIQQQQSVWVSHYDIAQHLRTMIDLLELSDWVKIYEANSI